MRHWILWAAVLLSAVTFVAASGPSDPYLWLEEVDGEQAMEWVKTRNAHSTGLLEEVPEFDPIRARFLEIYNSQDRIPYVSMRGDHLYNFWQDAEHARGIWRRTTLEEYRKDEPAWEVLLDIDALSAADDEKWVYKGIECLPD